MEWKRKTLENEFIPKLSGIDYGEAYALAKAAEIGKRRGMRVIVVANDNQPVGRSWTLGFSRSDPVDRTVIDAGYVKEATTLDGMVVVIADTHTDDNLSDIGTRPNEPHKNTPQQYEHRRKKTWERLQTAYSGWLETGEEYHVRPGLPDVEEELEQEVPDDD